MTDVPDEEARSGSSPSDERWRRPRWVTISMIVATVIVLLVLVVILIGGGHGPGQHI